MPLSHGLLSLPGITPQSKACAEELLAKDLRDHHCFYGRAGFHNHLPHFVLAAYSLGAPEDVLRDIFAREVKDLRPLQVEHSSDVVVDHNNWTLHLGEEEAYAAYMVFFQTVVRSLGVVDAVKTFVFSPAANNNGASMLVRLVSGAVHPLIQLGYGLEFGDELLVVSGLAQTACHDVNTAELFEDLLQGGPFPNGNNTADAELPSLFSVLRQFYDSDVLTPVMPYDPDALLSKRRRDAFRDGTRGTEIVRIASMWSLPQDSPPTFWEKKLEETFWMVIVLLFSTGKPNRPPRLDFFIMHMVTSSLFLPVFFNKVLYDPGDGKYKAQLLQAYLRTCLAYLIVRGRPRIDPTIIMHATASPQPSATSNGSVLPASNVNPWMAIVNAAINHPEAHLPKVLRTLVYATQKYGRTPAGGVPGVFDADGAEVLPGLGSVDGSLFVRGAGVMMNTLGWVSHGEAEGEWDRSALGWDDAWKE